MPAYAAAKGGLAQLTKALANEWAGRGVNVNAIAPGYMRTDNTQALFDDPVRNEQITARIPAGRWGTPDDLGGACVFLASQRLRLRARPRARRRRRMDGTMSVATGHAAVVRTIEELGVVAVIRMRDAAKLRHVIDALADGGVRAIEVTMTVPNAVALIEELAPSLPSTILLGAGTVTDAIDGSCGHRRGRPIRRGSGLSP